MRLERTVVNAGIVHFIVSHDGVVHKETDMRLNDIASDVKNDRALIA